MNIGMLWFDNDPKAPLKTKVERAAAYYQKKYKQPAALCYVNPRDFPTPEAPEQRVMIGAVEVRPHRSVMVNHFWIGQGE